MNFDAQCRKVVKKHRNLLVPWWLMASYAYYCKDVSILSDACFDEIAQRLKDEWVFIEHPHKYLIDREMTNSGHYIAEDRYPSIVKGAAERLIKETEKT